MCTCNICIICLLLKCILIVNVFNSHTILHHAICYFHAMYTPALHIPISLSNLHLYLYTIPMLCEYPETFFQPRLYDQMLARESDEPLPKAVLKVIMNCSVDCRKTLLSNIVLSGMCIYIYKYASIHALIYRHAIHIILCKYNLYLNAYTAICLIHICIYIHSLSYIYTLYIIYTLL